MIDSYFCINIFRIVEGREAPVTFRCYQCRIKTGVDLVCGQQLSDAPRSNMNRLILSVSLGYNSFHVNGPFGVTFMLLFCTYALYVTAYTIGRLYTDGDNILKLHVGGNKFLSFNRLLYYMFYIARFLRTCPIYLLFPMKCFLHDALMTFFCPK